MGSHKADKKIVGAYLESELREYFDKFAKENGFFNKSDALKEIIRQHRSLFFKKIDGNMVLTPVDVTMDDNVSICKKKEK